MAKPLALAGFEPRHALEEINIILIKFAQQSKSVLIVYEWQSMFYVESLALRSMWSQKIRRKRSEYWKNESLINYWRGKNSQSRRIIYSAKCCALLEKLFFNKNKNRFGKNNFADVSSTKGLDLSGERRERPFLPCRLHFKMSKSDAFLATPTKTATLTTTAATTTTTMQATTTTIMKKRTNWGIKIFWAKSTWGQKDRSTTLWL